ncbi:SAM-dependent methyltransferase [Streptomyces incarnatus]
MDGKSKTTPEYSVVRGGVLDPYEEKVVRTYEDDPADWHKVLGEHLLFEWGVYNHPDSPRPVSLDEAGIRFFERQLELAGLTATSRPPLRRILDLGCGWGYIMRDLADRFPECPLIDGINISPQQLDYCARYLAGHRLTDRTRLYLCNGRDVDLIPDRGHPYDLVVARGVFTHFPRDTYETCLAALARRAAPGGLLVISDTLFKSPEGYESAIPDEVDRLACGNRKSPAYFAGAIEGAGFTIEDMRVLPSNTDVAHWFLETRSNIETWFPDGVTGALEDLRVTALNMSVALLTDQVSAYSVVARRDEH